MAITSILALSFGGCSLMGGGESISESTPSSEATPEQSVASAPEQTGEQAPFENPTVAAKPGQAQKNQQNGQSVPDKEAGKGRLPANLIAATNPNQRFRSIAKQRTDPFAMVAVTPKVTESEGSIQQRRAKEQERSRVRRLRTAGFTPPQLIPSIPMLPPMPSSIAARLAGLAEQRAAAQQAAAQQAAAQAFAIQQAAAAQQAAEAERRAEARRTANKVSVSGVVLVSGKIYAIVDAPNEPGSRYVQAGQRISEGRILVKYINPSRSDPSVVLEYDGVEVMRAVGEPPVKEEEEGMEQSASI